TTSLFCVFLLECLRRATAGGASLAGCLAGGLVGGPVLFLALQRAIPGWRLVSFAGMQSSHLLGGRRVLDCLASATPAQRVVLVPAADALNQLEGRLTLCARPRKQDRVLGPDLLLQLLHLGQPLLLGLEAQLGRAPADVRVLRGV